MEKRLPSHCQNRMYNAFISDMGEITSVEIGVVKTSKSLSKGNNTYHKST